MDFIKFVGQDFTHFVCFVIVIIIVFEGVVDIVKAWKRK